MTNLSLEIMWKISINNLINFVRSAIVIGYIVIVGYYVACKPIAFSYLTEIH